MGYLGVIFVLDMCIDVIEFILCCYISSPTPQILEKEKDCIVFSIG